ncbi:MAG: SRPBCC domain-containing protein [Flavobacterium sp.]|uniref:SRPBCC family protein n=1 Tax=Flavobacterium sp. TaxID=239 RepID=UPI0032676D01
MTKSIFKSEDNRLTVTRTFNAHQNLVWSAWTEPALLDLWWAPKPWKSETSYMSFVENGHRIYAMVGPMGERHVARTDYKLITPHDSFSGEDSFCDPDGTINTSMPIARFKVEFFANSNSTEVILSSEYQSKEHLEQVIAMGMKEGLNMAFDNLDDYIEQQFKLRKN